MSSVHSICFSPTGTTRTIVQEICKGTGKPIGVQTDITLPCDRKTHFAVSDPVVIGMPVYGGRLPVAAVERLRLFQGAETPAAITVIYGNRAYDDALLELYDLCTQQGFTVVAAAAFIGEHSFSSDSFPIAPGRPDEADQQKTAAFGKQLSTANQPLDSGLLPGNRPYKPVMQPEGGATDSNRGTCTLCGQCAVHCPTGAIHIADNAVQTDPDRCIWCAACVKTCPTGSRRIILPKIYEIAERLHANCQTRREPEWFPAHSGEMK
jgi:ferredoxin